MKTKYVKISNIIDIQQFVQQASRIDGDVLVKKGKFVIDGKSLMGLFSIDMTTGVSVEYPNECIEFDRFLQNFVYNE